MTTLAVDLGGTRLKAGRLVDGVPVDVVACEHGGDWLPALREVVRQAAADEVALCVPGIVGGGRVRSLPGKLPGIDGADLAGLLGVRVPVLVNDAVGYGIGEAVRGAGEGLSRVLVVTLGTGVGVAVVEDGEPLGRGPLGAGVLGGQLPLSGGGLRDTAGRDTAGRTGTIEALCRADALVAHVPGADGVAAAYDALMSENPAAVQGFSRFRADLVRALTALCLAHAPDAVVVGGGAARPSLLTGVEAAVRDGLWPGQSVVVRVAVLGDAAALHGLGELVRARVGA